MRKERERRNEWDRCKSCNEILTADDLFVLGDLCMECAETFGLELPLDLIGLSALERLKRAEIYLSLALEAVRRMRKRAEKKQSSDHELTNRVVNVEGRIKKQA